MAEHRVQRHDFMNHVQIIHSLLQMGKSDRALKYIENMAIEGTSVNEFLDMHFVSENCLKHK